MDGPLSLVYSNKVPYLFVGRVERLLTLLQSKVGPSPKDLLGEGRNERGWGQYLYESEVRGLDDIPLYTENLSETQHVNSTFPLIFTLGVDPFPYPLWM